MGSSEFDDVEKVREVHDSKPTWWGKRIAGLEAKGIQPIPEEDRTDTQYSKIFFIWFTSNTNILSFSAGTLGPVVFGLGLRDTCLVLLFFGLFCSIFPAYLTTWGPKLGLRQMIQARYSFGYYGVIVPCIFNLMGMFGFSILNAILGGQALSSVTNGHLSWAVGIVIIAIISLLLSFCGYTILNWYERVAWVPVVITYIIAAGLGGKHLISPPPAEPATAKAVLSFASTVAGFMITYSSLASDFTSYFRPDAPRLRIFLYSFAGFSVPFITIASFGAACAVAAPTVPDWNAGYDNGNVGGLLEAMLHPVHGFGKFLTVLLSLSVTGNMAMTFYSISLNLQVFISWIYVIPRFIFPVLAIAIVIPLAIVGSHQFYDTLTNFLGLIGYWAAVYIAIVLLEHKLFRRGDFTLYDISLWNNPKRLPWGAAALGASAISVALIIPSMEQVWFTGPIGEKTGDIGFEMGFALGGLAYIPLRWLEIRVRGSL